MTLNTTKCFLSSRPGRQVLASNKRVATDILPFFLTHTHPAYTSAEQKVDRQVCLTQAHFITDIMVTWEMLQFKYEFLFIFICLHVESRRQKTMDNACWENVRANYITGY